MPLVPRSHSVFPPSFPRREVHRSRASRKRSRVLPVTLAVLLGGCASAPAGPPPAAGPITPTETIRLFDGRDLSSFYTWVAELGYDDPHRVFSVVTDVDGKPSLRISGEDWGALTTRNRYANYHLVADYRWGQKTWGKRADRTRDSGVLVHAFGRDGNVQADFRGPWLTSIEYQIIEGGTGDIILVGGFTDAGTEVAPTLTSTVRMNGNRPVFDPGGQPTKIRRPQHVDWWGRSPEWKDELGFRGPEDVEKPVGEWNRLEIIARGNELTYLLNGKVVNGGSDVSVSEGKIVIQSEGAEIFFRDIELRPIR